MKRSLLFFIFTICFELQAQETLNCLILLNAHDTESIGNTGRFYLISKVQSAIAEQTCAILLHSSLFNSFIERRTTFEQLSKIKDTRENKILNLYSKIQERIRTLSNQYNKTNDDIVQNKSMITQNINQEFYNKANTDITDEEYQLFLNYITPFDYNDWSIYKKGGFYLLIPQKYQVLHFKFPTLGFKLANFEKVSNPEDIPNNYFDSQSPDAFLKLLPEIFMTYEDRNNAPYAWNIIFSGHGGSYYKEKNNNGIVTWIGEPLIADLNVQAFKGVLNFFQTKVKTHIFHYSCCSGGGNHIDLLEDEDANYNFPIVCECLTDCTNYCRWKTMLPSKQKSFLTNDDLYYDSTSKAWALITNSPYEWAKFFKAISKIDFSQEFSCEAIERLPKILSYITHPVIANISLIRRPITNKFYPISASDTVKIDDILIKQKKENKEDIISLKGSRLILLENNCIDFTLNLETREKIRFISIKPDESIHYIKKIISTDYIDLPRAFCQAEYQTYNKTFIIDECTFPHSKSSLIYKDIPDLKGEISLKNIIIVQQSNFFGRFIRLFFTIKDLAMMVVTNKVDELDEQTVLKEIIRLTPEAQIKYEAYYLKMKKLLDN